MARTMDALVPLLGPLIALAAGTAAWAAARAAAPRAAANDNAPLRRWSPPRAAAIAVALAPAVDPPPHLADVSDAAG